MIKHPYLLITNIPCFVNSRGERFIDPLWHKDVAEHRKYISDLTIACPLRCYPDGSDKVLEGISSDNSFRFLDLPSNASWIATFGSLPITVMKLIFGISRSRIVHCGVAGWPIPFGWIAVPLARLCNRNVLTIVESAPWRLHDNRTVGFFSKSNALIHECFARACVRSSHLSIFTQPQYRASFLGEDDPRGHVIPASWIDAEYILEDRAAEVFVDTKASSAPECFRMLFAGRLVQEKGIKVLIEAIDFMTLQSGRMEIDILGNGPLLKECQVASQKRSRNVSLRLIGTVPYGLQFFELLRSYHAVVVPSLADEQPRIIFDAFSQGVPVIASRTSGISSCVEHLQTGVLFETGNPRSLAAAVGTLAGSPELLRKMGRRCLSQACGMTHEVMHSRRCELLEKLMTKSGDDSMNCEKQ